MLAMIFTAFVTCISGAIILSRNLVVKSESECLSRVWARAVLSEYDVHLLEDYGIMAYFGSEKEINRKLDFYMSYSLAGKLDAKIGKSAAYLGDYVLADPDNFRKSMRNSFAGELAEDLLKGSKRTRRADKESSKRRIGNKVVIDTLPSRGLDVSIDAENLGKQIKSSENTSSMLSATGDKAVELAFIRKNLSNCLYAAGSEKTYFENEWEYIICGKLSDEENYSGCRTKLFVIRNLLNLASLYKDSEKIAAITEIAELISPGPAGLLTQALIAETWAAAETEADLKTLYSAGRVPLIKSSGQWKTSLRGVLNSEKFKANLSDEEKDMLEEKEDEIGDLVTETDNLRKEFSEGQTYEDYLALMILALNDNVRVLRIMDIVQINMKYRYYADFNMQEYYTGTDIAIEANGREYEHVDKYK